MASIKPKVGNVPFDNNPMTFYGGYRNVVFYGLFEDTKTFPSVPAITATTTHADAVTAAGTLTPNTGAQFGAIEAKVHRNSDEGDYSAEDNSASEHILTFNVQASAEAEGFLLKHKGAHLWAAVQKADGTFRLYGNNQGYPAKIISAKRVHPEDPKDAKGPEIEIKVMYKPFPPAFWNGTISTAVGV